MSAPVALDMLGIHTAAVEGGALVLAHRAGDRRSIVEEALLRQLRVVDGAVVLDDEVAPLVFDGSYRLSPFELRYAADAGRIHPIPLAARASDPWRPVTDLHTHFAGCISGADLVRLGADIVHPWLEEMKIREAGGRIGELGEQARARLAAQLEVPIDRRVTFLDMERIYRFRSPFTKAESLFVPLLRQIAVDYATMGVRYAELSLGNVVEARVLRAIHEELPAIEAATGVTLRFLAAISRHDDPEWDLDLAERIAALRGSGYIVGIDVMGHETNSTSAFAPTLQAIAKAARPGFVVRVHAGESPAHPENVRLAIEAVRDYGVELRIGHGLYGVDEATLAALVDTRTIVEFNLDSNVALNHLQSARSVSIRRYIEAGVRVVLGSDGYGIYGTSPAGIAQAARIAGLLPAHLERIAETEREVLSGIRPVPPFAVPDDRPPVHFTPAVIERRRAAAAAERAALEAKLAEANVPIVDRLGGRIISVAGAWRQTWEAMQPEQRALATRELEAFVDALEADVVLVTGGTRFGVEGIVARRAIARKIPVLAALVWATPPDALEVMTHAMIVGATLYEKAAGLYAFVAKASGVCLFVSGGQIVSDEIQTAQNLRLRYLLMDGVGGASERHAREQPARAVRRGIEAVEAIREWRNLAAEVVPHWYEGPNPTVDAVVVRGGREVLLVQRDLDAPAEPGKWALPGGFVRSDAPRGSRWVAAETAVDACIRELGEETGLAIAPGALVEIGVFEGGGRDPRDTATSWSRTTVFRIDLDASHRGAIAGGDDAADARWFSLDALPHELAFDHAAILAAALRS